ncbi:MAG: metallophosphoesterase family protein [Myxococcota bacterium]
MPTALRTTLPLALLLAACPQPEPATPDASTTAPDAGAPNPYQDHVTPDPSLDAVTPVRRGPYLQAPGVGTVTVSWHTDDPSSSRVSVGREGEAAQEVTGVVFTQRPTTAETALAGSLPEGFQHEVVLTGLQPGARYVFKVTSAKEPHPGGTFVAPPQPGDAFSFLVMGDTRTRASEHARVVQAMSGALDGAGDVRFLVNTGDLVAVGGDEENWDVFFTTEAPVLSRVPLLPVFGNHELILGRTIFDSFFKAPPTSSSTSDTWYSAVVGDVHLATVDPYALPTEPHLEWLLQQFQASHAPFKLVALHAPLYTRSNHEPDVELREELLPVLRAAGVQVVLSGHNHCYERWFGEGIQFVVTGGGGAPLYGVDDHPDADNAGAERKAAQSTLHFLRAEVNGTRLRVESISVPDGATVDCFMVDTAQPGVDLACP